MYLGEDTTAAPSSSWVSDIAQAAQAIVPAIMQTRSQQQLIQANLVRAQQGLPPLDISSVTPGLNVGLSADTQKLLMYIGGAALAIALAYVLLKHGRR